MTDAALLDRIEADDDAPTGPAIDGATLRAISAAVTVRTAADRAIEAAVDAARAEGLSWSVIGAALGITRQGALKRYGKG